MIAKYNSDNQRKKDEWAWHVARMGEMKRACRVLVKNPEGNTPLGRARRGWWDNIEMGLKEVNEGHGLDLPESSKEQVAGSCECGSELLGSVKCEKFLD